MKTQTKRVLWATLATLLIAGGACAAWFWQAQGPVLKSVARDLKAGAMARHAPVPFQKFMELRYGPMTEPSNRQQAFMGFFDSVHIEGLHRLVTYMKPAEREANIAATAQWISNYRKTMSPAEKEALKTVLNSGGGRVMLKQATAKYLSQDAHYRAATAPVIAELMVTLDSVQKN